MLVQLRGSSRMHNSYTRPVKTRILWSGFLIKGADSVTQAKRYRDAVDQICHNYLRDAIPFGPSEPRSRGAAYSLAIMRRNGFRFRTFESNAPIPVKCACGAFFPLSSMKAQVSVWRQGAHIELIYIYIYSFSGTQVWSNRRRSAASSHEYYNNTFSFHRYHNLAATIGFLYAQSILGGIALTWLVGLCLFSSASFYKGFMRLYKL